MVERDRPTVAAAPGTESPKARPAAADTSAHFVRAVAELGARRPVFVRSSVYNTRGVKLLGQGVRIDECLYERLHKHLLAQPLAESLQTEFVLTAQALGDAVQTLCCNEPLFALMAGQGRQRSQLLEEISLLPLPAPVAFQLTLLRETRPAAWMHALRAAVTAAWLAVRLGGNRYDQRHMALAGVTHDLGLLHLDPLLEQSGKLLSRDQQRQLDLHPVLSTAQLERHHEIPRAVLAAVLEHHELLDGSGYPRHLVGQAISTWGRALAMAELATGMFSGSRPYPARRLSLAMRLNHRRYDAAAVAELNVLLARLPPDPPPPPTRDPLKALAAVELLLQRWPSVPPAGLISARQRVVVEGWRQATQALGRLAAAGATQAQLAMLGPQAGSEDLRVELDLLVGEMVWQLQAVGRLVRRRWRATPDEQLPAWLKHWLEEGDALAVEAVHSPSATAEAVAGVAPRQ